MFNIKVQEEYHTESFINKPAAQAAGHTPCNATPPVGKIHPFSKIAVTVEQYSDLNALQDLESL